MVYNERGEGKVESTRCGNVEQLKYSSGNVVIDSRSRRFQKVFGRYVIRGVKQEK